MARGKFIIYSMSPGKVIFSLKACNGQVIATSPPFSSSEVCEEKIELVKKLSVNIPVDDKAISADSTIPFPKFELVCEEKSSYRFMLKTDNDTVLLYSDVYKAKASCLNGIDSIRRNAPSSPVHR